MPLLFSSLQLRQLVLSNRIVVSSMLTNASVNGCATDWHVMHYGNLAISGMGMINFEATAVEEIGRIGPRCLGLYSDEAEDALGRVVRFCRANSETKLGLQLAHAGRKGAIAPDSVPRRAMTVEEGGWRVVSSSAYEDGIHARPDPLDNAGIKALIEAWKRSTARASRLGFDSLDLHFAHGYLINQFLSPLINSRTDGYGGSRDGRMRLALEIFEACRAVWPAEKPIGVRISATDWAEGGWNIQDSVALARELRSLGCDYICASSGGVVASQKIAMGPGYQVPLAEKIRRDSGIVTMAVGQITEPDQAESILAASQADLIALGRRMLYNPRWAWHAAVHFGIHLPYHFRYRLCHPSMGPMLNFPETKENTQLLSKLRTADEELGLDRFAGPGTVPNQI